jgi:hypothetical protein
MRYLPRYCSEFNFRWNHRKTSDGERMVAAIRGAKGKRLMYRPPKNGEKVNALEPSNEEKELLDSVRF